MKKLLPALTAFMLIAAVAFTACGKKDADDDKSTTESTSRSTTNLSQAADEFTDDVKTTIDEMKSDISEMMPGSDEDTTDSGTTTSTTKE